MNTSIGVASSIPTPKRNCAHIHSFTQLAPTLHASIQLTIIPDFQQSRNLSPPFPPCLATSVHLFSPPQLPSSSFLPIPLSNSLPQDPHLPLLQPVPECSVFAATNSAAPLVAYAAPHTARQSTHEAGSRLIALFLGYLVSASENQQESVH